MKTWYTRKEASSWLNSLLRLIKLSKTARTWFEFLTFLTIIEMTKNLKIKITRSQRCSPQQIMANSSKSIEPRRLMSRTSSSVDFNQRTISLGTSPGVDYSKPLKHHTAVRKDKLAGTISTTGEPIRYQQLQLQHMAYTAVGATTRASFQELWHARSITQI